MDKEMQDEESAVPAASHRGDTLELPLFEDAVLVDKDVIEKLTEGLISHYLPDLQHSKLALQELTKNQSVLLDTLDQEIAKFRECNSLLDINALKRALKLQQQKHKEVLEQEQQRERELERERQLIAKPAKKT
ncbi:biogenesis of lysosome-related organelles complex 1 subunit 6 isoform X2 [Polypterus senegalus]|uniref:biogenesis of lysosome-related organelles complex 1 subunit 6 isoform X2 n=1 Tax=Polypterus senegalus TaxID=55291 RepID=UPI001965AED2|nr:biogenesis of lysosome-related organelles complex 1 subunit 6 isoform X2 [Polypterus senegalus]